MHRRYFELLTPIFAGVVLMLGSARADAAEIPADPSDYVALLDTLVPGDVLQLAPGNYPRLRINGINGTEDAWITIEGPARGAPAVITSDSCCNTVQVDDASFVAIRNLTVDAQGLAVDPINAKDSPSHHILIENNTLIGFPPDQLIVGINTKVTVWNWTIRGNLMVGAGTGIYLGNSNGASPFVNGLVEGNVVVHPLGYCMQIKQQNDYEQLPGMPDGPNRTIIRNNVFIKDDTASPAGNRPNLLVGGFPDSGYGTDDMYEIYGNVLLGNPRESLLQATGSFSVHDNLFIGVGNDQTAITVTSHQGKDVRIAHLYNNTVYGGAQGIRFSSGALQSDAVVANLILSGEPIGGSVTDDRDNLVDTVANAGAYMAMPSLDPATMDFYPLVGAAQGSPADLSLFSGDVSRDRDFNGDDKLDGSYRGAYSGEGANPGCSVEAFLDDPMSCAPVGDDDTGGEESTGGADGTTDDGGVSGGSAGDSDGGANSGVGNPTDDGGTDPTGGVTGSTAGGRESGDGCACRSGAGRPQSTVVWSFGLLALFAARRRSRWRRQIGLAAGTTAVAVLTGCGGTAQGGAETGETSTGIDGSGAQETTPGGLTITATDDTGAEGANDTAGSSSTGWDGEGLLYVPNDLVVDEDETVELILEADTAARIFVTGLPPGMHFNEQDRRFSFRPDFIQGGTTWEVQLYARARGEEQRAMFSVTVNDTISPADPVVVAQEELFAAIVYSVELTTDDYLDPPGLAGRTFAANIAVPNDSGKGTLMPLGIGLHGAGGSPGSGANAERFGISPHEPFITWWTGEGETRPDEVTEGGVIDYSQRRILHLLDYATRTYPGIDRERVSVGGQSMGGSGANFMAAAHGRHLNTVFAGLAITTSDLMSSGKRDALETYWGAANLDLVDEQGRPVWGGRYDLSFALFNDIDARNLHYTSVHGKNDRTISFRHCTSPSSITDISYYDAAQQIGIGHFATWDQRGHSTAEPGLGRWWEELDEGSILRRDLAFVAFSNGSADDDPGVFDDNGGQSGDDRGALNRYMRWDGSTIVDTYDRFEVPIYASIQPGVPPDVQGFPPRGADYEGTLPLSIDVTPRRVQRFQCLPNEPIDYVFGAQNGTVNASPDGSVTIRGLMVDDMPRALILTRQTGG